MPAGSIGNSDVSDKHVGRCQYASATAYAMRMVSRMLSQLLIFIVCQWR